MRHSEQKLTFYDRTFYTPWLRSAIFLSALVETIFRINRVVKRISKSFVAHPLIQATFTFSAFRRTLFFFLVLKLCKNLILNKTLVIFGRVQGWQSWLFFTFLLLLSRCLHVKGHINLGPIPIRFYFNPLTSVVSAAIIWAFVGWCIRDDDALKHLTSVKSWVTEKWTWLYVGTQDVWALFIIALYFSKYSNMRLGKIDIFNVYFFSANNLNISCKLKAQDVKILKWPH